MSIANCIPPEKLKEYLSGCLDEPASDSIESHLRECSECERNIAKVEVEPDSIEIHVRQVVETHDDPCLDPPNDAVAYALGRVKQLKMAESSSRVESSDASKRESIGKSHVGPYEIVRSLGQGGMGCVYLAKHRQLHKQVAIKILPSRPFQNDKYAARFKREIRTVGGLHHAAIVQATDAGEDDGEHYLVMEYVDGLDVSRIAKFASDISVADVCSIARSVALGLSHAHAMGIVHRDIKPSNLMISKSGEVKILDFGLAQVSIWDEASAELTTVGQLMGTLDYMAPEQAERAEAVDYRADLYSLGATIFRLLCGRAPLVASPDLSPLAKLRVLGSQRSPKLNTLRPDAPAKLVDLVDRLLAREPDLRPPSAAHVAEELCELVQGADLQSLVARAIVSQEHSIEQDPSSVVRSQSSALPKLRQLQSDGNGNRRFRWIVAIAMAPLALLGIFLTLEWNKGQLIIESETANVQVKVLRDGENYKTLKVVPGANATRLYAGKYEIAIDGTDHALEFNQTNIDITRGKTVIARIRSQDDRSRTFAGGSVAMQPPTNSVGNEPLFDGKPLSYWLNEFEQETKTELLELSLRAISSLLTEESKPIIADRLWKTLPNKRGDSAARGAIVLVWRSLPRTEFYDRIVEEIRGGETDWICKLMQTLTQILYNPQALPADTASLINAIENRFATVETDSRIAIEFAQVLVAMQSSEGLMEEHRTKIERVMMTTPALGDAFWYSESLAIVRKNQPKLLKLIQEKAVDAIIEDLTPRKTLVSAIQLFSYLNRERNLPSPGAIERRNELSFAIGRRLREWSDDLVELTRLEMNDPREIHLVPGLLGRGQIHFNSVGNFVNLAEELLEMGRRLNLLDHSQNEIAKVRDRTMDLVVSLSRKLAPVFQPRRAIQISWPRPGRLSVSDSQNEELLSTTEQEWTAYLIMNAIAKTLSESELEKLKVDIATKRDQQLSAAEAKSLDTNKDGKLSYDEVRSIAESPSQLDMDRDNFVSESELFQFHQMQKEVVQEDRPTQSEPLYDGKSVRDWLTVFARETSETKLEEALKALQALRTKENQTRIYEFLWKSIEQKQNYVFTKEVPSSGGQAYAAPQRTSMDTVVFQLLRSCVPAKTFVERVATELKKEDAWCIRILKGIENQSSFDPTLTLADLQPLVKVIEAKFASSQNAELNHLMAVTVVKQISNSATEKDHALFGVLTSAKSLTNDYWFSRSLEHIWLNSSFFANLVQQKAVATFLDMDASMVQVLQASKILEQMHKSPLIRTNIEPLPQADEILNVLRKRIQSMCDQPERLTEAIDDNSVPAPVRMLKTEASLFGHSRRNGEFAMERIAFLYLIDLATSTNLTVKLEPELEHVMRLIMDDVLVISPVIHPIPFRIAPGSLATKPLSFVFADGSSPKIPQRSLRSLIVFCAAFDASSETIQKKFRDEFKTRQWKLHAETAMSKLDQDRNGVLDYKEIATVTPQPQRLDKNQDGSVSIDEVIEAVRLTFP